MKFYLRLSEENEARRENYTKRIREHMLLSLFRIYCENIHYTTAAAGHFCADVKLGGRA